MKNRTKHLNSLKKYIKRGEFPTNKTHPYNIPIFVDDKDIHCAVGYILKEDNQFDIINNLQQNFNYNYIEDMNLDPIKSWLENSGLGLDELKLIQPSYDCEYGWEEILFCYCDNDGDGVAGYQSCGYIEFCGLVIPPLDCLPPGSDPDDNCFSNQYQDWYYDNDDDGLGGEMSYVDVCTEVVGGDFTSINGSVLNSDDVDDNCYSNEHDCAEVCDGNALIDECGVCGGDNTSCQQLGDINGDGIINVIDIVMAVDLILNGNYDVVADVNEDGQLNVLDVVMLVDWVLNGEPSICDGLTEVELLGEWYDIATTTSISFAGQGLSGSIPPEIGCLTNLTFLNLGGNQLTGEIPPEIGNLTNLTQLLNLYDNQLTGEIPESVGNLTNLTQLYLGNNQLSGEIPSEIWEMTNLTWLDLGFNQFTGELPIEIGNLTNLEYLILSSNQLSGEIPIEIGNLTNLTYLRLNSNQLNGEIPPEIGNLTNLTSLQSSYNQLSGDIPSEIGNLTNLTYLSFYSNQLTGEIPSSIGQLTNLTQLILSNNQLTGEIPSWIGNLTNLTNLDLRWNELTGEIPSDIGSLTNLTNLTLAGNQLTGEIPPEVCDLVESNNWASGWTFENDILEGNNLINTCD